GRRPARAAPPYTGRVAPGAAGASPSIPCKPRSARGRPPMAKADPFRDEVLERLSGLDGVRCRAMFGGYGLYLGEHFFGVIAEGRLYLRVSEATLPHFEHFGMGPFRPAPGAEMPAYYEGPPAVYADPVQPARGGRAGRRRRKRKGPAGGDLAGLRS